MTDLTTQSPKRTGPQVLSTLLFVAAIGFAAAAVYLWFMNDDDTPDEAPVPTAEGGVYELANVLNALEAAGLEAEYGRSPATARTDQLDQPGQNLRVEDTNVYIFFCSGSDADTAAASCERAFAMVDPSTMTLTTTSGKDVGNGETLTPYQGANVIAVLIGGDDALRASVRDAIEGLE